MRAGLLLLVGGLLTGEVGDDSYMGYSRMAGNIPSFPGFL